MNKYLKMKLKIYLFVLVTRLTPHAFVTKTPNDSAKNVPLQKMEISVV